MNVLNANFVMRRDEPELNLLVDHIPTQKDVFFERKGDIWFAEVDGYCMFMCHPDDGKDHEGCCGRTATIKDKAGKVHNLIGPWSSNPDAVQAVGFPRTVEVCITINPEEFSQLYGGSMVGYVTKEFYDKIVSEFIRKYPFPVPDVSNVKPKPMDAIACPHRVETIRAKKCTLCGTAVEGFATEKEQKEYLISGWCHECQERIFNIPEM